jgi:hypothetical protein
MGRLIDLQRVLSLQAMQVLPMVFLSTVSSSNSMNSVNPVFLDVYADAGTHAAARAHAAMKSFFIGFLLLLAGMIKQADVTMIHSAAKSAGRSGGSISK